MAGFTPRLAALVLWLARPHMWSAAFNGNWFWPLLGVIFLPFTTIMYVILWTPVVGLTGWDWMWLVLAVFCDVAHYSSTAYSNRNQIPGYSSSTPSTPSGPSVPGPSGANPPNSGTSGS
jgi:hypothetical protein